MVLTAVVRCNGKMAVTFIRNSMRSHNKVAVSFSGTGLTVVALYSGSANQQQC